MEEEGRRGIVGWGWRELERERKANELSTERRDEREMMIQQGTTLHIVSIPPSVHQHQHHQLLTLFSVATQSTHHQPATESTTAAAVSPSTVAALTPIHHSSSFKIGWNVCLYCLLC